MSHQARRRPTRLFAGLFGVGVLLGLGACAGLDQRPATTSQQQFAANWQEHSKPLLNHGPWFSPGTTAWFVPSILPRGTYRVISRNGNDARLIDGYRFEVDTNPGKEIRLLLPAGYSRVEALEEKYVIETKSARATP
jgi:hypothetical protein